MPGASDGSEPGILHTLDVVDGLRSEKGMMTKPAVY